MVYMDKHIERGSMVIFDLYVLSTVDFSGVFEHSVLRVLEIYALENVMFNVAVYGPYKP